MKTPLTYYGGKQKMAKTIIEMMPKHRIYCEPFFGGGAVFFAKPKSYLEVINDKNDRLITFYRMIQNHFEELHEMVNHTLCSESEYRRARKIYSGEIEASDIEIAWSVWVTINMSFNGSPMGGWKWCNGSAGSHTGVMIRHKREEFNVYLKQRLQDVQISCREALEVIKSRDSKDTFFYLDPLILELTRNITEVMNLNIWRSCSCYCRILKENSFYQIITLNYWILISLSTTGIRERLI